jgi:hypothetical protein
MKSSRNFFVMLPLGFALMVAIHFGWVWLVQGVPTESSRWCYELNAKKLQAAQAMTNRPKLLLVGGSATLFGVSARDIQRQTGMPTVNMSTHAALGTDYILYLARQAARPGDTVLLILEYELYNCGKVDPRWADAMFIDYVLARDPAYIQSLSWWERISVYMLTNTKRLKRGLKNWWQPEKRQAGVYVYKSELIDEYGDQTGHGQAQRPAVTPSLDLLSSSLAFGLETNFPARPIIEEFCEWARAHNVRVLASYPNIHYRPEYDRPSAEKAPEQIRELFASLHVPVLGTAREAIMPANQFFDTYYHPTQEAAHERTRRLLVHLAPYLKPAS